MFGRKTSNLLAVLSATVQKCYEHDPSDDLIGRFNQQNDAHRQDLLHYDAANLPDGPGVGAGLMVHNKLFT